MEPEIVQAPPPGPRPEIVPEQAKMHYTHEGETWTPRTYADELAERGEDPRVRVRCECRRTRPAYAVIDARSLPEEITGGQEWACDACKTSWVRSKRNPLSGRAELVERLGAPEVVREKLAGR